MTTRRPKAGPRELSWGILGESQGILEGSWEPFGSIFEGSLQFQATCENSKKHRKINGFSLIFKVPGRFWGFENVKKSKKVSSERLRGANNDIKRGQERLRERKMSQHEAPKGYDTD